MASLHDSASSESGDTASIGAEVVASPEDNSPSGSSKSGRPITSTTIKKTYNITKRRSAPALIQGRTSPTMSAQSDVTLLNPSIEASPLTPRTPIRMADADEDGSSKKASSSQQELGSSVWVTLYKVEKEKSRYHEMVGQLQADLATERENAQHDRGEAQHALGEAQDDIADLEAEISELKDQLENDLVEQLQADLATEREDARHDRGVARQALEKAQDDIADLEAEVSELQDLLRIERQNAEDNLRAYNRSDRDATDIIEDYNERISDLEARLNHEQRKARHNFSKAEEYMVLATSWQNAFYQLGHDPDALFKMLVEELKARGLVFHGGRMHRVGLRRAVDVEEWVAGVDDGSLRIQEVNEEDNPENGMSGISNAADSVVRQPFGRIVLEETEMDDRSGSGQEPLVDDNAGEAVPHNQRHRVSQGSEIADLVVAEHEDFSLPGVEDEAEDRIIDLNRDLADVSNISELSSWVSPEDGNGNGNTDGDGHETLQPMQLFKHRKVRAVNRSSETESATWEIPSPLQNSRIPSLGSRLVPPTMGNGLLRPLLWSHYRE